ncbi:DUF1552 domain-containing protein [Roseiconus nitratireducens]|uniref:DUF1552 domain-containing protein n=2 Tax=Roseiconus nitratireducens TaxID=2605748 RepID=A0A5M6DI53_9BACT|nr:DUF1552 domain-containing protein [Roseiconus nitratireducens]
MQYQFNPSKRAERSASLHRRRFLRGLGAAVAVPMFSSVARAAEKSATDGANLSSVGGAAPLRMAYFIHPNGVVQDYWFPKVSGDNFEFNRTMKPLEDLREHVQVITGLDQLNATPGNDGGGDHARAGATYLTGMRAKKTGGKDIRCGISVDQVAAQQLGHLTRFPSLELTCDAIRNTGSCDTGYACAYQYNMSWSSPMTPVTPEPNPRLVFERLFGIGNHGERKRSFEIRRERQKSILDFVMEDTRSLIRDMGHEDQLKLDEYLTNVREIERRISDTEQIAKIHDPKVPTPAGIPDEIGEHMDLMYDLLVLAFQTDQTRIATLLLAYDGSNLPYPQLGISEGHHWLTHNLRVPEYKEKVGKIEVYWMEHFAKFIRKMRDTQDVDGSRLIDNVAMLYGSAISDGNRHKHDNCPAILVGGGGGMLQPGRVTDAGGIPMSNLYVSLLEKFGVQGVNQFGDSTGSYNDI